MIALAVVFMSWFLWERYMKTKYKPSSSKPSVVETVDKRKSTPVQKKIKKSLLSKKEEFFNFEDDKKRVIFSSKGMGIKELELKSFFDREQKKVRFKTPTKTLFEITEKNQPLFFDIKTIGKNQIQGWSEQGGIQVLIHIKDYSFSYEVQVKNRETSSLEVHFVAKPIEGAVGLIQSLIAGREPGLGLFVKNSKEEKRILYSKGELEEFSFSQVEILGLGSRYFGQAFFNESDILPTLNFQGDDKFWKSRIVFKFPQTGRQTSSLKISNFLWPKIHGCS